MTESEKDQFHDLKNCIYNIRNCIVLIKKSTPDDHPNNEIINTAFEEIDKALDCIRQIKDSFRSGPAL